MKRNSILAIDLGATKVACVVGQPANGLGPSGHGAPGGELELVGSGVAAYPLKNAWPNDPTAMAQAIERALEASGMGQEPGRVVVGLSHPALSHHRIQAHIDLADEPVTIRSQELWRLHAQAVGQGLGIDRDVLLLEPMGYDGNGFTGVNNPRGLVATRLSGTFQLITIPLAIRQAVSQALEAVGVESEGLRYSFRGTLAACMNDTMSSQRILVIDIGGCCTDMAILEDDALVSTQTVPWGGMVLVEAIAKAQRLTMDQALSASLQGWSSPTPAVQRLVEQQLSVLNMPVQTLLKDAPLPSLVIVTGRTALMDGLVEWVERTTEIPAVLGRSSRAKHLGDLNRQLALTPAIGLLELTVKSSGPTQGMAGAAYGGSSSLVDRLIDRTKRILVDYF